MNSPPSSTQSQFSNQRNCLFSFLFFLPFFGKPAWLPGCLQIHKLILKLYGSPKSGWLLYVVIWHTFFFLIQPDLQLRWNTVQANSQASKGFAKVPNSDWLAVLIFELIIFQLLAQNLRQWSITVHVHHTAPMNKDVMFMFNIFMSGFLFHPARPALPVSCWRCSAIHATLTQWNRPELERSLSKLFSSFNGMSTRAWWWTPMGQVSHHAKKNSKLLWPS